VTDAGKEVTACSQFKRVAFVPIQNTKHPMLLLKLPQTSIWDKDAEEWAAKGWYAFDQYLDLLLRRGVNHTASVVTKIRFDPRTAYPKLLFGPLDWVPQEVVADIKEQLANKDQINKILNVDPSGVDPDAPATAPAAPAAAAPAKAATPPAPPPEDDDAGAMMAAVTGKAPAAPPAPAKPAARAGKPAAPAAAKPNGAKAAEPQVVTPASPKSSGIKDLLSSWSDES
jgi:septal ring-binding cell division protein DamX